MNSNEKGPKAENKRGRPLDPSRSQVILESTLEVLSLVGYAELTMEAVASHAKVGKATIYRRWPSKNHLVKDAINSISPIEALESKLDTTKSLRDQLIDLLELSFTDNDNKINQQTSVAITTALAYDKELEQICMIEYLQKLHEKIAMVISPFLKEDSKLDNQEMDLIVDAGPALLCFRKFLVQKEFDRKYIENIVDHLLLPMLGKHLISS